MTVTAVAHIHGRTRRQQRPLPPTLAMRKYADCGHVLSKYVNGIDNWMYMSSTAIYCAADSPLTLSLKHADIAQVQVQNKRSAGDAVAAQFSKGKSARN